MRKRIFLSPPWVGEDERKAVKAAFDSNYVAPCGPCVDAFEAKLAALAGRRHAIAVSGGTAAIDLVMAHLGVDSTWTVFAPTLTFIATVGPAYHRGAKIVFIDSDATGNIDTALLKAALEEAKGVEKKLVISVDLYGRCCDYGAIDRLCRRHGAVFLSDSAEALGAKDAKGKPAGAKGFAGIYSFNGNKIITTSGGGAVVTDSKKAADHIRKLSQQSREPCLWYEHKEVGYNYRMSNILGAIGLAQIAKLPAILEKRRTNRAFYESLVSKIPQASLLPPVEGENNWLTVVLLKDKKKRDGLLAEFAANNIEARPVWKPMHLQPVFSKCAVHGGRVAEDLFRRGVCLPSGTGLTSDDLTRIGRVMIKYLTHK